MMMIIIDIIIIYLVIWLRSQRLCKLRGSILKLDHQRFLPRHFLFIIHYHRIIRRKKKIGLLTASLNKTTNKYYYYHSSYFY
jgi:hypothetical protein